MRAGAVLTGRADAASRRQTMRAAVDSGFCGLIYLLLAAAAVSAVCRLLPSPNGLGCGTALSGWLYHGRRELRRNGRCRLIAREHDADDRVAAVVAVHQGAIPGCDLPSRTCGVLRGKLAL